MAEKAENPEEAKLANLAARVRRTDQRLTASMTAITALYTSFPVSLLQFVIEFLQCGTNEKREEVLDRALDFTKQTIRQVAANSKDVRLGMDEYADIQPQLKLTPSSDRKVVNRSALELHEVLNKWAFQLDGWLRTLAIVRNLLYVWPWQTDVVTVAEVIEDCTISLRDDATHVKGVLVFLSDDLGRFIQDSTFQIG